MEIEMMVVPLEIRILISLIIELLKRFGKVPDGQSGKIALSLNVLVMAALTIAVQAGGLDVEGLRWGNAMEIVGLLGQLGLAFLASVGTHKLLKTAEVVKSNGGK